MSGYGIVPPFDEWVEWPKGLKSRGYMSSPRAIALTVALNDRFLVVHGGEGCGGEMYQRVVNWEKNEGDWSKPENVAVHKVIDEYDYQEQRVETIATLGRFLEEVLRTKHKPAGSVGSELFDLADDTIRHLIESCPEVVAVIPEIECAAKEFKEGEDK